MAPDFEQKVEVLFQSALKLDPAKRAAFVESACGDDVRLRHAIESRFAQASAGARTPRSAQMSATSTNVGEIIAHYKIISALGHGGMGEVFLAQDTRLGRKVALKLLPKALSNDEERLHRFEREAQSASALNHPNVCVIHEIGETEDRRPYISMEYIDGQTLRKRFSGGQFKLSEAIDIALQTASALAAAHEAGVVHRDIKPENIMLRRDGYVKVLDFGLAKLTDRYERDTGSEAPTFHAFSTHSGVLLGTTNYLSPEQARRAEVDERADVWGLGVVLYEMIAGRLPFAGETPSHVIVSILEREPESLLRYLPDIPPELDWVVKKALRKDREGRYQTIKEFLSDLDEIKKKLASSPSRGAEPMTSQVLVQPSIRHSSALESISYGLRRPRISIAVLLVVLGLVGLAVWMIVKRVTNRPLPLSQSLDFVRLTNLGNVADAAISPDGKYVVYVMEEFSKQSLWTWHVPTSSSVMIAAPDDVRYVGLTFSRDSNYIYYVRQDKDHIGSLYQVAVVGAGAIRKLATHVDSAVTLSPDGHRLAFIRVALSMKKLIVAAADGSGERELASGDKSEGFGSPVWSPDNTMIAFALATFVDGFHTTIVANPVDGGPQKTLSAHKWYSVKRLTWVADNSGLLIDASDQPYGVFQLWHASYPEDRVERITNDVSSYTALGITSDGSTLLTVKADRSTSISISRLSDPSHPRRLISGAGNYFGVSWFPDGRIAFSSMAGGNPDIWSISADGTNQRQLTANNGANYHPAVSPDGRYIAFTCYRGVFRICRMDADGSNQIELTNGDGASYPNWSPDAQWVYYDVLAEGSASLWKVRVDGKETTQILNHYARGAVASPDGRFVSCTYFDDQTSTLKYGAIAAAGGTPIKLFGNPEPNSQRMVRWMPDNQTLVYVDNNDGAVNVWTQPLNVGEARAITNYDSDRVFDFDLSRDGKQLVLTRGNTVNDVVLIHGFKKST
jgi:serine/threonine protein kinase